MHVPLLIKLILKNKIADCTRNNFPSCNELILSSNADLKSFYKKIYILIFQEKDTTDISIEHDGIRDN